MPIQVHIKGNDGALTIGFRGTQQDATYIAGRLRMEKSVQVGEPFTQPGTEATGKLYLHVMGLSRDRAIKLIEDDPELTLVSPQ